MQYINNKRYLPLLCPNLPQAKEFPHRLQTLQTFHTSVTPFPGTAKGLGELSVMNVINSRINCNDFTYN